MALNTPKLRNPHWQAVFDHAAPHLEGHRARMSEISDDIRTLEKYLTDSTFRIDTRVGLPFRSGEHIGWSADSQDVWRITYFWPAEDEEGLYLKPLLEAPVAVRWRAAEAIPELIREIGRVAAPKIPDVPLTDDEIPF